MIDTNSYDSFKKIELVHKGWSCILLISTTMIMGNPWEEFNRIVWCATVSPIFATGQLNGYFSGMNNPVPTWYLKNYTSFI